MYTNLCSASDPPGGGGATKQWPGQDRHRAVVGNKTCPGPCPELGMGTIHQM